MTFTDEQLSAYLDGALPEEDMTKITDALAASDELMERLESLKATDSWLERQFSALDDLPIRSETLDLIANHETQANESKSTGDDTVVALKPRAATARATGWPSWGQAIAASVALIVGVVTGMQMRTPSGAPTQAPLQTAGLIAPSSPLYDVLQKTPSMQPVNLAQQSMTAQPTLSFKTSSGSFCREFQLTGTNSQSRNVACRATDGWLIQASVASSINAVGGENYIPATADNAIIDQTIRSLMAGDILTAADETAAIERDWQ